MQWKESHMKTIIVPTDFSEISINAIYYAMELAEYIKAEILLLHVVTLPVIIEVPFLSENINIMEKDATDQLEILKEKIMRQTESAVCISLKVAIGSLLEEINNIVGNIEAFAIVIGIKGAGATQRILFGSKVFTLMNKLNIPVIIIPDEVNFTPLKNIGVAIDMKDVAKSIPSKTISTIINLFNSSLHILFVSKHKKVSSGIISEYSSLQNNLAKYHPKFHHIINEDTGEGILNFLRKGKINLLLVIPKKHGFMDGIFHKSISKDLAMNCRVPIMTIHS